MLAVPDSNSIDKWMGPAIKMSLPSFSGHTEYNPQILKYSCQIDCRVRAVEPAKVSKATQASGLQSSSTSVESNIYSKEQSSARDRSISVLLSKPLLALEFNFLKMQVEAPTVVGNNSTNAGDS